MKYSIIDISAGSLGLRSDRANARVYLELHCPRMAYISDRTRVDETCFITRLNVLNADPITDLDVYRNQ